jgi:hypothetical protein
MEATLVMEEAIGRRVRRDEQVIPRDGDLFNTDLPNLELIRRQGVIPPQSDEEFRAGFWARVEKTDSCWLWQGPLTDKGYGDIHVRDVSRPSRQRSVRVHRLTYEWAIGPIPKGLVIDHLCRVRNCVNPEHLEAVTQGENTKRGQTFVADNLRKTHCPQKHPYDAANTIPYRNTHGGISRYCRICQGNYKRAYRERKRSEGRQG